MSATYTAWCNMKSRCLRPSHPAYKNYGGRGITVCKEWLIYYNFHRDMGRKPKGYTLERIDNNLGYYKENCKWATYEEQLVNQRPRIRGYKRPDNKSGITGVIFHKQTQKWRAYCTDKGRQQVLYAGNDFFEACCKRRSYEVSQNKKRLEHFS